MIINDENYKMTTFGMFMDSVDGFFELLNIFIFKFLGSSGLFIGKRHA